MSTPRPSSVTRRRAFAGVTSVGLALPVLSACGDGEATDVASDPTSPAASDPTTPGATTTEETTDAPEPGVGIVSTTEVPVGSGVILAEQQVVVTQPSAGEFKAFSAVCTHTGCTVAAISDIITCPCHNSTFDITTGDVLGGPAPSALPAVEITVEGDQVVLS